MVQISEDRRARIARVQDKKNAPPEDLCTAPDAACDDIISLIPRPPAQEATSRQARLQAVKAKRAARAPRDADAELVQPVESQEDAGKAPKQGDRQLRLAALKAKRAARSHNMEDDETAFGLQGTCGLEVLWQHSSASPVEAGAEESGAVEDSRASRRERVQAMRTRCADREQAARNSTMPLSDLLDAAAIPVDQQTDAGTEDSKSTRSAVQRRMDHIRLSRASREEDRQLLESRAAGRVEASREARSRPPRKDAFHLGNEIIIEAPREAPRENRHRRPSLTSVHVETAEHTDQSLLECADASCLAAPYQRQHREPHESVAHIQSEERVRAHQGKPRPPAIHTDFDDGKSPVICQDKDGEVLHAKASGVNVSEATSSANLASARVLTEVEVGMPSMELSAHQQGQSPSAVLDLVQPHDTQPSLEMERCYVEPLDLPSTFTRFDGGEVLIIDDLVPNSEAAISRSEAESADATCEEESLATVQAATVDRSAPVALDLPCTRLAARSFPLQDDATSGMSDAPTSSLACEGSDMAKGLRRAFQALEVTMAMDTASCCGETVQTPTTFTRFDGGELLVLGPECEENNQLVTGSFTFDTGSLCDDREEVVPPILDKGAVLCGSEKKSMPLSPNQRAKLNQLLSGLTECLGAESAIPKLGDGDQSLATVAPDTSHASASFDHKPGLTPSAVEGLSECLRDESAIPEFAESDPSVVFSASDAAHAPTRIDTHPELVPASANVEADPLPPHTPATVLAQGGSTSPKDAARVSSPKPHYACTSSAMLVVLSSHDAFAESECFPVEAAVKRERQASEASSNEYMAGKQRLAMETAAAKVEMERFAVEAAAVQAAAVEQRHRDIPVCLQSALDEVVEEASDMNHVSEVGTWRRAALQKLKEKREARSQQARMVCDDPEEDCEPLLGRHGVGEKVADASSARAPRFQRSGLHGRVEQEAPVTTVAESSNKRSVFDGLKAPEYQHKSSATSFSEQCEETSYAEFQRAQRHNDPGRQNFAVQHHTVPARLNDAGHRSCVRDGKVAASDVDLSHMDPSARRRRIRELQQERGIVQEQNHLLDNEAMDDEDASDRNNIHVLDEAVFGASEKGLQMMESVAENMGSRPECWWNNHEITPATKSPPDSAASSPEPENNDEIIPSKKTKIVILGPHFSQEDFCRSEPEPELELDHDYLQQLQPLKLSRLPAQEPITMTSLGPPICEPAGHHLHSMWSRYADHCHIKDTQHDQQDDRKAGNNMSDDAMFEELQGKWRDARGGMAACDLRPEFRALLAPFDVQVDLGCGGRRTSADSFQAAKALPRLAAGPLADVQQSQLSVHALPTSAEHAVSLPSLTSAEKVRPTLNQLPKDRQRENCVHQ